MDREQLDLIFLEQREAMRQYFSNSAEIVFAIAQTIADTLSTGNKVLLFGNGGSAADAQHVAAELIGRFTRERTAWPAIALTTDTSVLTAVANDYGYENVFLRQVQGLALKGDLVVGISTSGRSLSILKPLQWARSSGIKTIGFTGDDGGQMPAICDLTFKAPSTVTARIQEIHLSAWHVICDLVETEMMIQ